jgi:beta-phosphoglucomutase
MDGVIADTNELHFKSWRIVLPEYGLDMSPQDHHDTFGMNNKKILTILRGEETGPDLLQEISDRKEQAFRDLARSLDEPMPGVLEWMERFESWGFKQAIASSAPIENIHALVESMDLAKFIDAQISGYALPAKPDPAIYLEAASRIGVPAGNSLVIEDAIVGIQGARNAGMTVIGVATTHPVEALQVAQLVVQRLDFLDTDAVRELFKNSGVES